MYAKSFIALDGNGHLTGARTAQQYPYDRYSEQRQKERRNSPPTQYRQAGMNCCSGMWSWHLNSRQYCVHLSLTGH